MDEPPGQSLHAKLAAGNALILRLANHIEWQIDDQSHLNPQGWHLIVCNHLSWTDIVIIGDLFRTRLPVPKFSSV